MSVEASEALSEVWTRWQGHVINSEFRLGRCLGSSDHSGVYLTRSAAIDSADLAIKLVPTNRALAEQLLPRWKRASALTHPHLLRLLAWGGCQLEGLPYLYLVMEYADQTLAQLLAHRALAAEEARQLLVPSLDALGFLHGQGLVQGQLKPTNMLVVGEQLKLASDTIRRVGEGAISTHTLTAYDPPEGRQGNTSPAGDVWALGVTLFEALTRRLPAAADEAREEQSVPPELAQDLRERVIRCLSADPRRRPSVAQLLQQEAAPVAIAQPTMEPPVEASVEPAAEPPVDPAIEPAVPVVPAPPAPPEHTLPPMPVEAAASPVAAAPALTAAFEAGESPALSAAPEAVAAPAWPRTRLIAILGAVVVVAVVVGLVRGLSRPSAPPTLVSAHTEPAAQSPVTAVPATTAGPGANTARGAGPAGPVAVHQVIPDVPPTARRTIRGHIKVWVRVVVDTDGSVFAAVADRAGPSHYFQRLAVEAAKKWTFPPTEGSARRIMQVQFDFSRDGTAGRARPVS
jgi:serine/threonine-protein kinase